MKVLSVSILKNYWLNSMHSVYFAFKWWNEKIMTQRNLKINKVASEYAQKRYTFEDECFHHSKLSSINQLVNQKRRVFRLVSHLVQPWIYICKFIILYVFTRFFNYFRLNRLSIILLITNSFPACFNYL